MHAKHNLAQFKTERNGHRSGFIRAFCPTHVRTTRPTLTTLTQLVIPAGAVGRIIEIQNCDNRILIDFGLATVIGLPANSGLIEFVTRDGER